MYGPAWWTSWTGQLEGPAGWTSWTDQLHGRAGQTRSFYLKPWPVCKFEDCHFRAYIVAASKSNEDLVFSMSKQSHNPIIYTLYFICVNVFQFLCAPCVCLGSWRSHSSLFLMLKSFYNLSCGCIHLCVPNIVILFKRTLCGIKVNLIILLISVWN